MVNKKQKDQVQQPVSFELKLANGKCRRFDSSYEMWKWATQNSPSMDFKFDDKKGPFLCDYFDKLRQKKST